jgi:hypothetical protein
MTVQKNPEWVFLMIPYTSSIKNPFLLMQVEGTYDNQRVVFAGIPMGEALTLKKKVLSLGGVVDLAVGDKVR